MGRDKEEGWRRQGWRWREVSKFHLARHTDSPYCDAGKGGVVQKSLHLECETRMQVLSSFVVVVVVIVIVAFLFYFFFLLCSFYFFTYRCAPKRGTPSAPKDPTVTPIFPWGSFRLALRRVTWRKTCAPGTWDRSNGWMAGVAAAWRICRGRPDSSHGCTPLERRRSSRAARWPLGRTWGLSRRD